MFDVNIDSIKTRNDVANDLKSMRLNINPNAFYMGIVVENNDSYNLGRVRVRVPSIHGTNSSEAIYVKNDALPWARPAIFPSLANDSGQYLIPPVRS